MRSISPPWKVANRVLDTDRLAPNKSGARVSSAQNDSSRVKIGRGSVTRQMAPKAPSMVDKSSTAENARPTTPNAVDWPALSMNPPK